MKEPTWKEAMIKVLKDEKEPIHYTDLARLIVEKNIKKKVGHTPYQTVSAELTRDANSSKPSFERLKGGLCFLRELMHGYESNQSSTEESALKIITSFGIYWDRELIDWNKTKPDLYGNQMNNADAINFKEQKGIYLLHDIRETIYIGQGEIGSRLKEHTKGRVSSRWNRFSWFGLYDINEEGNLIKDDTAKTIDFDALLLTFEALLIESIEPRQNRQRGKDFKSIEYLQYES